MTAFRKNTAAIAIVVASSLAAAGCVRVGKAHPEACPEYQDLVCMTEIRCDWEDSRECSVCACHNEPSDADPLHPSPYMPPGSSGTSGPGSTP